MKPDEVAVSRAADVLGHHHSGRRQQTGKATSFDSALGTIVTITAPRFGQCTKKNSCNVVEKVQIGELKASVWSTGRGRSPLVRTGLTTPRVCLFLL